MSPDDFKYVMSKQFVKDSDDLDKFRMEMFAKPTLTKEEYEKRDDDSISMPLQLFHFPWNEKFEGLVFQVGKVNIEEIEEQQTAQLRYEYRVLNNPNELDLAEDHETSRDNPDNELLDVFIGRVIESLLYRMSQDEEFLEQVGKPRDKQD